MNEALLGVIAGGLITAVPTIITVWITKRSEDKRHFRDKVVSAAIEEWRMHSEHLHKSHPECSISLDAYLIRAAHLIQRLDGMGGLTVAEAREIVRSSLEISYAAHQEAEKGVPKHA